MAKGKIFQEGKMPSREDQPAFDRWLEANAIVGLILTAGLVAMALAGSNSVTPRDAVVAGGTKASDAVVSEQGHRQIGAPSTPKLAVEKNRHSVIPSDDAQRSRVTDHATQ